jgi:hypothetical protein
MSKAAQGFSLRRTRRTRLIGREALLGNKRAVYGWKLTGQMKPSHNSLAVLQKPSVRIAR